MIPNFTVRPARAAISIHGLRPLRAAVAAALTAVVAAAATPGPTLAQEPRFERGTVGAGLLLRQLDGVKRVLVVGAHPDDEDTSLLSALARGYGAETAYLSLTRGDGGQNLIGPELNEGLGVVRTGELLAARRLDGGRQFFTRAFDYGYSKSAEEAFSNWPREELLRDVVWVVRSFRPQVIVSVFSGTPADGHGQHQAAGIMAGEAFRAAADPARFPDQLADGVEPWQPAKLYRLAWRNPDAATAAVHTGTYDPLLGRSHHQLAMQSRSQHRSQDMGQGQPLGPRVSALVLEATAPGLELDPEADAFFAGVDTALTSLAERLPSHGRDHVLDQLRRYRDDIRDATAALGALDPSPAAPHLARALDRLSAIGGVADKAGEGASELGRETARRADLVRRALMETAGLVVDVRVGDDLLVPGDSVELTVELWNGGPFTVEDATAGLALPPGWEGRGFRPEADPRRRAPFGAAGGSRTAGPGESTAVAPGESVTWRFRAAVPAGAEPSELYYLGEERDGEMYRWPDDRSLWGLPFDPPLLEGRVDLGLRLPMYGDELSVRLTADRPAEYVGVDKALGEFRRLPLVVPALSVGTTPDVLVWPVHSDDARTVTVDVTSFAESALRGSVALEAPAGWSVEPANGSFAFEASGQRTSVSFSVRPGEGVTAGRHTLRAVAVAEDGRGFSEEVTLVDYAHIDRVALFDEAATRVTVVPVAVTDLDVGYIMGSGDAGFEAIDQLGMDVALLSPEQVRSGEFRAFDVLVLGVRAYETRPDVVAANEHILDFARRGGTVVVQYNKYEYPQGGFAPYPVQMSRPHDRVTDQGSPVAFLAPRSPVLSVPNRITEEDFEGWVTERGLYFLGEWDDRYTPVLELTDPGEEPKRGSILVTPLGEGLYVYTGLSFFRQLPEGVPGAYRLFANLVSLEAADWHAWANGATR